MEKRFWKYFKNSSKYIYLNLFNNLKFLKKKKNLKMTRAVWLEFMQHYLEWFLIFLEWFTDIEYSHKI